MTTVTSIRAYTVMKMEKISETQIKVILNESDLLERDIKLTELAYGSEKTQALFHEMMEQASEEYGFESENMPLLIEAIPLALDSIIIIITKVTNASDIEEKFNMIPRTKEADKFKSKDLIQSKNQKQNDYNVMIFSFDSIDDAMFASSRLLGEYTGANSLFKDKNKYFLVLQGYEKDDITNISNETLDAVLSEYGQKYASNVISKYYLYEHGELIIKDRAVEVLATL